MGDKIKAQRSIDFPIPPEGWGLWRVDKAEVRDIKEEDRKADKDGIINDRQYVLSLIGEGAEIDAIGHNEFFAFKQKGSFGLMKLYSIMVACGLPDKGEIDSDMMVTEKFQSTFQMKMPKCTFGGRIKHNKNKDNPDRPYANIVEFVTARELPDIVATAAKKGKAEGKGRGKEKGKEETEKAESGKEDEWGV